VVLLVGCGGKATNEGAGGSGPIAGAGGGDTGGSSYQTTAPDGGGASSNGSNGGVAGDGTAGDGTAGDGTAGDGTAGDGTAGAPNDPDCAVTELVQVPIEGRVDLVFDEKRCAVYISTQSGVVQAYDIREQSLEPLIDLGAPLVGVDLSPDQNTLLVANSNSYPDDENPYNEVFVVDLAQIHARTLQFLTTSLESGTFVPLFLDNDTFLLTSMFAGSGHVPLRKVDVTSGEYTVLATVTQNSVLALSADRSTAAVGETQSSSGPVHRYLPTDESFEELLTGGFVGEIAVNRDGTRFAMPVDGRLRIYNYSDGFDPDPVVLYEYERYAEGVAYSPDANILYVSWRGFGLDGSIEALDSNTFELLFTLDSVEGRLSDHLRVAPSGDMIGARVEGGVRLYPARNAAR